MKIITDSHKKSLIIRLKRGDQSAFNEIYRTFSKSLYLKVLRMVKDQDVADEIIQELFIKFWDHRQNLDEERSFQSYLYVIAQNMVYNYFRKQASDQKLLQVLINQHDEFTLSVEELMENKELSQLLSNAVKNLSPQRKQAFTLCKIEGRSYKEASEIMGVSVATINTHITQSLQIIKAHIIKHRYLTILALEMLFFS